METPKPTEDAKPSEPEAGMAIAALSRKQPQGVKQAPCAAVHYSGGEPTPHDKRHPAASLSEQGGGRNSLVSRPVRNLHVSTQIYWWQRSLRRAPAVAVVVLSVVVSTSVYVALHAIYSEKEPDASLPSALSKEILDRTRARRESLVAPEKPTPEALSGTIAALNESALRLESIGDMSGAYDAADRARQIIERQLSTSLDDTTWQHELSIVYERLGRLQLAREKLQEALKFQQASLAIRDRLVAADSSNAVWQRDLAVAYEKIGDVQLAQGNLSEAAESYQANLAIRDRLIKSDPGNARLARDLVVSHFKLGDLRMAEKNWAEALESYQAGLPVSERLAKANPDNEPLQRDLAAVTDRIGDAETAQGDLLEGLRSFQASFFIRERMAKFEPGETGWQRDLAVSYGKIARIYRETNRISQAIDALRQGREILARLERLSPGNAVLENYLARFDGQLANLTHGASAAPAR
jgi:tetratricopeptide (TPR) repeat protein